MGPLEILEGVDTLAYKVALPPNLSKIHNVFHVSYCGVGAYSDFWRLDLWRSTNLDCGCDGQCTTSCCCQVGKGSMEQPQYSRSHLWIRGWDERKISTSFSRPRYVKFRGLKLC